MISIEQDIEKKERFEFNRPFQCIEMRYGNSTDELPKISWDNVATITWLDYDGPLTSDVIADVRTVCTSACPGSILIISVNAHPSILGKYDEDNPDARLESLKSMVGEYNVPRDITGDKMNGWGLAKVCRQIFQNTIHETLNHRNGARQNSAQILYKQLYNFHYSDGVKMLTVGGIFYDDGLESKLNACSFSTLPFISFNDKPYAIDTPSLTLREIRHLNTQLPTSNSNGLSANGVPKKDVENYATLYRYFPTFAEADI